MYECFLTTIDQKNLFLPRGPPKNPFLHCPSPKVILLTCAVEFKMSDEQIEQRDAQQQKKCFATCFADDKQKLLTERTAISTQKAMKSKLRCLNAYLKKKTLEMKAKFLMMICQKHCLISTVNFAKKMVRTTRSTVSNAPELDLIDTSKTLMA